MRNSPQMMLRIIARFKSSNIIGIRKVNAKKNFEMNVAKVVLQMCLSDLLFSDSSEMWIPNESESASAIAIIKIPEMIIDFECVPEFSPMINPRVVITPDVNPNPKPFFIDGFINTQTSLNNLYDQTILK